MHLHITGSVTLSQIFVRGVRGSTDSLVLKKIGLQIIERETNIVQTPLPFLKGEFDFPKPP